MTKIKNKIRCKKDDQDIEISEINITKDMLCPKHLLEAEKEFLLMGGIFPQGGMEESKHYLAILATKILGCSYDDLVEKLSGNEFLEVTNQVKGLFDGLGLEALVSKILEKQS
nr:hypothetical protein [Fusobacterium nucleatum]DAS69962.1 MAG TPA: hypothetical protein [Caudoviricetes sp.]